MNETAELFEFNTREDFKKWLKKNHEKENGIWILFIKGSELFSAHDALEEALCFGWIDGLMKSIDEKTYKKYFSKRKDTKKWSEKNKALYKKLVTSGLITDAGIDVYKPENKDVKTLLNIDEKIVIVRDALIDEKKLLSLFDNQVPSRQKQLAGFYCEAKTEETKNKRKIKIIDALLNNYKGMVY